MASEATWNNPISILCNQCFFDVALGEAEKRDTREYRNVLDDSCLTAGTNARRCEVLRMGGRGGGCSEAEVRSAVSVSRVVFFTSSFRLPFANSRVFRFFVSVRGIFTHPNSCHCLFWPLHPGHCQACLPQNDP